MTLHQFFQHEEQVAKKAVMDHLQTAGVVLITLLILIGLLLGAFVAAELHQFNP